MGISLEVCSWPDILYIYVVKRDRDCFFIIMNKCESHSLADDTWTRKLPYHSKCMWKSSLLECQWAPSIFFSPPFIDSMENIKQFWLFFLVKIYDFLVSSWTCFHVFIWRAWDYSKTPYSVLKTNVWYEVTKYFLNLSL